MGPSLSISCLGLPMQVRTSRTFIRDCTVASPAAILLFGGALSVAHDSSYVQVDGWLRIRCGGTRVLQHSACGCRCRCLPGPWAPGWAETPFTAAGTPARCPVLQPPKAESAQCGRSGCRAPAQTAVLVKRLRQALDALLERKVRQPAARLEDAGGALIQSIVDLLNTEEAAQRWQR